MKLIVISQRVDYFEIRDEHRDALDQNLVRFIATCGSLAVQVPNILSPLQLKKWLDRIKPDGIVLSGGNDIDNMLCRDKTEKYLLEYASRNYLPLLGICRGMQMIGAWEGAELTSVEGHVGHRHQLIGDIEREVNSFHKSSLVRLPKQLSVLAHSLDGQIEAIRHLSLPWEGWMWHPEREEIFSSYDITRFRELMA